MPDLPLPPLLGGVPIDSGALPVGSTADVSGEWSQDLMASQQSPIRDAIIQGETNACLQYQRQSRYAAAQSDPLRATGEYLDEIGWERGIYRQPGETGSAGDLTYRTRVNAIPTITDPNDVVAAANAVLAPYTNISCRYAERSDGMFMNQGEAAWSTHLFALGDQIPHVLPNYPDRYYFDCTPAGLPPINNRRPPGAMLNGDSYGRWFMLRVPDIYILNTTVAGLSKGYTQSVAFNFPVDGSGFFLSTGTYATNNTFLFNFASTADAIYAAIVSAVEPVRGHSMRWTLFVDPALTAT